MTLEVLEARIAAAITTADEHAAKCIELIATSGLSSAIDYTQILGIEPPKASLTAQSENAKKLRDSAQKKLSDAKWWGKSLEKQALQNYENEQRNLGNVRNFVSDGVAAYMAKHKR